MSALDRKQDSYETAVIGILLNHDAAAIKQPIKPDWFVSYRNVITAYLAIVGQGYEPDLLTLAEKLGNNAMAQTLWDIKRGESAALSNLPKYLAGLQQMATNRAITAALRQTQQAIDDGASPSDAVGQLLQQCLNTVSGEDRKNSYTMREALAQFVDSLEEVYDARDSGGVGLKTGLQGVDRSMGGMHPSDLVVVGARPGVGKTAWGLSVMLNLLRQGKRVGFISTEMSVTQVMGRLMAAETGISGHNLRDANLTDADFARLTAATNQRVDWPLRICDKPSVTISDVMLQCKTWAVDGGVDFIVIDYLTRVKPIKASGSQVQDVGDVVTGMKNIARQLNIPLMVLAQLNRKSADRKDGRPMMSDLRDSGVIEQEADQILMLWRGEGEQQGEAEVLIEKNRHGQCGYQRCWFEANTMIWRDMPNAEDYA
jgi:replicative DNA helicase